MRPARPRGEQGSKRRRGGRVAGSGRPCRGHLRRVGYFTARSEYRGGHPACEELRRNPGHPYSQAILSTRIRETGGGFTHGFRRFVVPVISCREDRYQTVRNDTKPAVGDVSRVTGLSFHRIAKATATPAPAAKPIPMIRAVFICESARSA